MRSPETQPDSESDSEAAKFRNIMTWMITTTVKARRRAAGGAEWKIRVDCDARDATLELSRDCRCNDRLGLVTRPFDILV